MINYIYVIYYQSGSQPIYQLTYKKGFIMKIKNLLLAGLLGLSMATFAAPALTYVKVDPLNGTASVKTDTEFKVHYEWLSDGERHGKLEYIVEDTACGGEIDIDQHPAYTVVQGDAIIKCNINDNGHFVTETALQLYDGDVRKEKSDTKKGELTVNQDNNLIVSSYFID